ncbi:MAG: hypothetical protein ABSD85_01540 [Acidimicrobiales bacterium]
MSPAASHDSVKRSYDALAEQYEARTGGELAYKPLDRALLAETRRAYVLARGS